MQYVTVTRFIVIANMWTNFWKTDHACSSLDFEINRFEIYIQIIIASLCLIVTTWDFRFVHTILNFFKYLPFIDFNYGVALISLEIHRVGKKKYVANCVLTVLECCYYIKQ